MKKIMFIIMVLVNSYYNVDGQVVGVDTPEYIGSEEIEDNKNELCYPYCKVKLTDGQSLVGNVINENENEIELKLLSGSVLKLNAESVVRIVEYRDAKLAGNGKLWVQDPIRTGYFVSPSAMMLEKGEVSFSQKELLLSMVNVGLTDWATLYLGSIIPAWFWGPGFNGVLGCKFGYRFPKYFSASAGGHLLFSGTGYYSELHINPILTFTIGDFNKHVSLNVSKSIVINDGETEADGPPVFTLSGLVRISKYVAFLTENGTLPLYPGEILPLWSVGIRFMGEKLGVDLGLGSSFEDFFPMPLLSFSFNIKREK